MFKIEAGENDTLFKLNGLQYRKGQYEVFYPQNSDANIYLVGIRNINSLEPICEPTKVSNYDIGTPFTDGDVVPFVTLLSTILGFNMGGGGSGDVPNLQDVTDKGNSTSNSIITTGGVTTSSVLIKDAFTGTIKASNLTENEDYQLPPISGTIALREDILHTTYPPAGGDTSYTRFLVQKPDGNVAWENRSVIETGVALPHTENGVTGSIALRKTNNTVEMDGSITIPDTVNESTELVTIPINFAPSSTFTNVLVLSSVFSENNTGKYFSSAIVIQDGIIYFFGTVPTGGMSMEIHAQYQRLS